MPKRYSLPLEMEDAILIVETGWTEKQVDNAPENLLRMILLYKAVKQVNEYGGSLQF